MGQLADRANWRGWLANPDLASHSVQFYKDPQFLVEALAHFVTGGVARREAVVLVMTEEHIELLGRRLSQYGWDLGELEKCCGLRVLDAQTTLARFMRGGLPDEGLFFDGIDGVIQSARSGFSPTVRAFGEGVGLLWSEGNHAGALALEALWNRLIAQESLVLHCAYHADVFESSTHSGRMCAIHHAHTHVIAAEDEGALDVAVDHAMRDVFGPLAGTLLRPSLAGPSGSTTQLLRGLTAKMPAAAEAVLCSARSHYDGNRTSKVTA